MNNTRTNVSRLIFAQNILQILFHPNAISENGFGIQRFMAPASELIESVNIKIVVLVKDLLSGVKESLHEILVSWVSRSEQEVGIAYHQTSGSGEICDRFHHIP